MHKKWINITKASLLAKSDISASLGIGIRESTTTLVFSIAIFKLGYSTASLYSLLLVKHRCNRQREIVPGI